MTLNQFLSATSDVHEAVLRQAMAAALSVEPARSPEQYQRFYTRVVRELAVESYAPRLLRVGMQGMKDEAATSRPCQPFAFQRR
jgi:hypothetical protein